MMSPVGKTAASPVSYLRYQFHKDNRTAITLPAMWSHAAKRFRIRRSPTKSVNPATAARAAITRAAPRRYNDAVLHDALPVRQKIRSQTNVATRKETGN